ncbi:ribosome biogenesis GTP-binding protein YihA/YsxC [Zhaonella formicivorans]|uniref:ribosome biogenesis GTP-binding protein YihA/YsxC n=1 Tax=Zhaonella formicivorans TaxID=2528593 RepID=UPI0010EAD1B5|nr:ribosome biogenesis GTP-binding protein YihA/YsxC [Zhaonella formicivorans]
MKITSAEYVISAVGPAQYPEGGLPEVALAGKSNVGKSSLINALTNRKGLARTSQQPGKTQTLNFYLINKNFYLVDFPGYGFARVSQGVKKQWGKMIERYLYERKNLVGTILLVDIRHPPSKHDVQMFAWLKTFQNKTVIACTKADKISRGKWLNHLKVIKQDLQVRPQDVVIPCSAVSGAGIEELRKVIGELTGSTQAPV